MEMLRIEICGICYEFEVVEDFLQKTLGTFIKDTGWDKYKKENWDNSGFFNYQSKSCFTVMVDTIRRKISVPQPFSVQEKRLVHNTVEKENPLKSADEIESIVKKILKESTRYEEKQFRIKQYCTVSAYFLDGEWHWKTSYNEKDIHQSVKRESCRTPMTSYVYTGEELGLFKMPDASVFDKLFE